MNNDKLTPDRIEAAREMIQEAIDYVADEKDIEQFETILAALDLAERFRWRDPKVELPEEGQYAIAWITQGRVRAILYVQYQDGEWYDANADRCFSTKRYPVLAWLPLPEWEVEV